MKRKEKFKKEEKGQKRREKDNEGQNAN